MATVWTGSISFGLVSVPVKLTPATKSKDVSFNQLEGATGQRIRLRRVAEQSGQEVPQNDIVKGFEIEKGRYVIIDKAELDALAPKASKTIEIEDFVDLDEIDPLYFDTPYYVAPDEKAGKSYSLLVAAMTKLGKVAIGRFVMRGKERLVAIRPVSGVLCVETMHFEDEVLAQPDIDCEDIGDREMTMATQLVESLAGAFDPSKYKNTYRDSVLDLIDRKAAGETIASPEATTASTGVMDLMAALEASLDQAKAS